MLWLATLWQVWVQVPAQPRQVLEVSHLHPPPARHPSVKSSSSSKPMPGQQRPGGHPPVKPHQPTPPPPQKGGAIPPGYRPSSKHNTSLDKSGGRPEAGHHARSQSHPHPQMTEEQVRQQRERHNREQYKQQQQNMYPGYGRSSSNPSLPPPYPGGHVRPPQPHMSSQHQKPM